VQVLIVEDENGEIVRESMKDTEGITLYKNMRECLIYLAHLVRSKPERPFALQLLFVLLSVIGWFVVVSIRASVVTLLGCRSLVLMTVG
jgi:hypothetical protein